MAFGNQETWQGLAIFLDSFDNNGLHDNPKIMAVINDGTQRFDHSGDGSGHEIGSCMKDFRNKPNPVKLRIMYLRGTLEVWVHDGMSSMLDDYQLCLRSEAPGSIPLEGYFGVTAATGGLSDDHDALSFLTHRLVPLEEHAQEVLREVNQAEADQLADKYSSMSDQFDQQRQDYLKQHEAAGDWQYEIEMEQNVRHIADMQAQLSRDITQLSSKVESLVVGGAGRDQRGAAPDAAALKSTETAILQQLAQLRAVVEGRPGGVASEQMQPVYEVKNIVQQNGQRLAALEQRAKDAAAHQCPPVTSGPASCVSPAFFLVAVVVQVGLILGYLLYRQRQDAVAKKFF
jgi:mannose-binding lectin 1